MITYEGAIYIKAVEIFGLSHPNKSITCQIRICDSWRWTLYYSFFN